MISNHHRSHVIDMIAESSMQVGQALHIKDPSDTITKGERGLLAGEEAQVAKIIQGKLDVLFPTTGGPINLIHP